MCLIPLSNFQILLCTMQCICKKYRVTLSVIMISKGMFLFVIFIRMLFLFRMFSKCVFVFRTCMNAFEIVGIS